jgi:HlyD family secretion protein
MARRTPDREPMMAKRTLAKHTSNTSMDVAAGRIGGGRAVTAAVLLAALLALGGCSFGRSPATQASATATAIPAATPRPRASAIPSPTAIALVAATPISTADGALRYVGNVLAEDKIDITAEVAGHVQTLNVAVGDSVSTGDILLELDKATLEARRAQALAGLDAAQAQLDLLLEAPTESDLEAARAAVAAAEAAYQRALEGPTEEDLRAAEAQLRQAEAAVAQAQAAYDLVKGQANVGALPQSLHLEQATLTLEAAQAQYDKLVKGATADIIAAAYAAVSQARARLTALEEGPKDAQIRAARAQVSQAETALYLAQLELDKATVRAPMDGVMVAVNTAVGAYVGMGARLFTVQTHAVKIEVAVEETRLSQIALGQPAQIRVNAYPDAVFEGVVAIIAPALDVASRTVQVTIRPTGDAADLRPGMYATVEFLP